MKYTLSAPRRNASWLALALVLAFGAGAIGQFKTAVKLSPEMIEPRHAMGLAMQQDEDLDEAIEAFREVVRLKPDFVQAHNDLGLALVEKRDPDGAIAEFNAALRLEP